MAETELPYTYPGAALGRAHDACEYISGNLIGCQRQAAEYICLNHGVAIVPTPAAEYVCEGNVSTSVPGPHVWFIYKTQGAVGDKVVLAGTGLSGHTPHLWWMQDGTNQPIELPVDWVEQVAAGSDSYGADRWISPGPGLTTPPAYTADGWQDLPAVQSTGTAFTNIGADVLHVQVPATITLNVEPGKATGALRVVADNGSTSWMPWTLYAGVPVMMELRDDSLPMSASLAVRTDTVVSPGMVTAVAQGTLAPLMLSGDGATAVVEQPVGAIEQRYMQITPEAYIIAGSRAERAPLYGAYSSTYAGIGKGYNWIAGLEDALSYPLTAGTPGHMVTADARWLPDADKIVPREDLGSGLLTWLPSQGSTLLWLEMYASSAGYVDPTYVYSCRAGLVNRSAMVMDGSAWLRLNTSLAAGPAFSMTMVVMLRESKTSAQLFTTYSDTPAVGNNAMALSQEGDSIALYAGGKRQLSKPVSHIERPVIIALSSNGVTTSTVITDHTPGGYANKHAALPATGTRVYLGRPPVILSTFPGDGIMKGEILDLSIWNSTLTVTHLWQLAAKLDSIYGVTR